VLQTGTLTEEGLDLWGVLPAAQGSFQTAIRDFPPKLAATTNPHKIDELIFAMASAHSLTLIDGRLAGDPLDLKVGYN
jgi:cation-transporting ATPase 13A3/4/5